MVSKPTSHDVETTDGFCYTSQPLNSAQREVRLLHLLPGELDADISCSLEIACLRDCPKYEALSYTWGSTSHPRNIYMEGGSKFSVTDNLYAALRRLRRADGVRTLWIDAICIRQNDVIERSSQVAIMQDIYRSATNVLVWLGDDDGTTRPSDHQQDEDEELCVFIRNKLGFSLSELQRGAALTEALAQTRPYWWERAWVVQEFVLAQREPVMCFAGYEVRLPDFLSWIEKFRMDRRLFKAPMRALYDALQAFARLSALMTGRRGTLIDTFLLVEKLEATDPRDKIYSLLSMIDAPEAHLIEPDYAKSVGQVFSQATLSAVNTSGNLEALFLASFHEGRKDLMPSWSADFAPRSLEQQRLVSAWSDGQNLEGWEGLMSQRENTCRQAGVEEEKPQVFADGGYLTAVGHFLARISMAAEVPNDLLEASSTSKLRLESDPRGLLHSILSLLQHGSIARARVPELDLVAAARRAKLFGFAAQARERDAARAWKCDEPWTDFRRDADIAKWICYAIHASGSFRLFLTSTGEVGLGTCAVEAGDRVVRLAGSLAPAILRWKSGRGAYRFCGFAYVTSAQYGVSTKTCRKYVIE